MRSLFGKLRMDAGIGRTPALSCGERFKTRPARNTSDRRQAGRLVSEFYSEGPVAAILLSADRNLGFGLRSRDLGVQTWGSARTLDSHQK